MNSVRNLPMVVLPLPLALWCEGVRPHFQHPSQLLQLTKNNKMLEMGV
jgi:hypothetical protein